ncbi:MAG: heme-binding protein [Solirubrobacteraceae bacterium]
MATTTAEPQAGLRENETSFRAVTDATTLHERLGPLAELPGRWSGHGFNLIARPDFQGGNDIFLELNPTRETLTFDTIGSAIPNRGSGQDDIDLFGVHYLQQISDRSNGGALHIEPGIWITVPQTQLPPEPATIARLATIPHGDAANLGGTAVSVNGGPDIKPANTVPFPIGTPPPGPGTPNPFPEYNLGAPNAFRTHPVPSGVTQAMVTDPNSVLVAAIAGQNITHTEVLIVSSTDGGGIANIPFVVQNADAASASAIFWIETVQGHGRKHHLQLQYTQTVLLNFKGLSWPHVSVATLTKTF